MEIKTLRIAASSLVLIVGLILKFGTGANADVLLCLFLTGYAIIGYDILIETVGGLFKGRIFDENTLMTVATVGAFLIGEYPEALAIMLFFQIGEVLEDYAVERSRRSIGDLIDIQPETAGLLADGEIKIVDSKQLKVGDSIVVKAGEKVPVDGTVMAGTSSLDMKALTGESMPKDVCVGDRILSGSVNLGGVLTVSVDRVAAESTAAKIIDLIENAASKKSESERFITTFSRYYTPAVVLCAAIVAVVPPLMFQMDWNTWIYRALIFLVVSCPCALVISVPLTFFCGIGAASRSGILVKGSGYLEMLSKADTVVMDKTGTLTKGVFTVKDIRAVGMKDEELLETVAKAEKYSTHPVSASVRERYGREIDPQSIGAVEEIAGLGVKAEVDGRTVHVGNSRLMDSLSVVYEKEDVIGVVMYVSIDGEYAGRIIISDSEKDTANRAMDDLRSEGIRRTALLTGDNDIVGKRTAELLGIDEAYTEMLPADKVSKVEELMGDMPDGGALVYVGDGMNDAPVLARSDVGIAMGGIGSDAAVEAADVVIMNDDPVKIAEAVKIAKRTMSIVRQNIVLAIVIKMAILAFAVAGMATMWAGVVADVGVMLLVVLNSLRAMSSRKVRHATAVPIPSAV